ncbi:MAG TPA: VWA domain-containing protein [Vicinamibacteria bacterium]|nr:VWA domain-containing protein [Vicinamibacteria bacterium]
MLTFLSRSLLAISCVAVLASGAHPQGASPAQPPTTFPAQVEQVTVDVVVIDGKGSPVTDLKPEDLEIYEDGVRQTIAAFDLVAVPVAPAPPPEAAQAAGAAPVLAPVSTNATAAGQRGRTFVVVFDDAHLGIHEARRAKAAIAQFLNRETREGDYVTLLAAGGGAWWTARMEAGRAELMELLKRLEGKRLPDTRRDWISDYEAMRIHVYHDNEIYNRVQRRFETYGIQTVTQQGEHERNLMATEDPVVTTRAIEVYNSAMARNHVTLAALDRALASLAGAKGRKSLVLVSEGFIYDPALTEFKRILDDARRVNATIYFLNARGLEGLPDVLGAEYSTAVPEEDMGSLFAQEAETQEGAVSLAADTGGFTLRNSNDLASGLKRVSDESRAYYLLGYNPTNAAHDGSYRKIAVKVRNRRGLQVRARRGYYAPSDTRTAAATPRGTDPAFQAALDSPYEVEELPLRMTHVVREETTIDEARVYLAAEVDIAHLTLREEGGEAKGGFEYLMVTFGRDGGQLFRADQALELALPPDTRAQLARTWLPIVREFSLHSGRYRAKFVVRDRASGRLGTVIHDFEVPDLRPFRVSTPVLSDVRETTAEGAPADRLAILARRDFPQGDRLFCQVEVYRAIKDESSGLPKVSMGYEVRRSDGALLTREPPSVITTSPDGAISRMIGFSLAGAPPGQYVLKLRVRDEFSGETIERSEPFTVTAEAQAQAAR